MLDSETMRKLKEMGASELADALDSQIDADYATSAFETRIQHAVDAAYGIKNNARIQSLTRLAKLRFPEADAARVIYHEQRGLERHVVGNLASCRFIQTSTNIVFCGLAGTGKSWLGSMIAKETCKRLMRTRYIRMPDLMVEWEDALDRPQGAKKLLRRYGGYSCLVLDEWLLEKPDERQCHFLLELLERRYAEHATVFCTQYPKGDWHARLGGGVHADAIMDRVVHNCVWVTTGKYNLREHIANEMRALESSIPGNLYQ